MMTVVTAAAAHKTTDFLNVIFFISLMETVNAYAAIRP